MESCPKCGSPPQYAEKSPSGVNYFKCWSYTIGAEFEQSFSCSRITALAEENEYLKEEVTILESEVVHRDARIAELSAANGEVENLNVEGNLTYEAMKSRSDQLKKGDSNAQ